MSAHSPSASSFRSGFACAALAAALWSLITPFSRELFALGVPPLETAFWRAAITCLCFALLAWCTRSIRVPVKDALGMVIAGGSMSGLLFGAFQVSISESGGAAAVVLLYTAPAWVAVISRVLFQEAISGAKLSAMGLALFGVIMVSLSGGSLDRPFSALGIGCGLAAGFGYACSFPFAVWYGRRYPIQTMYTYAFLGCSLVLLPLSLPLMPDKSVDAWALLVATSLLTNFLAYIALAMSLKRITQLQSAIIGNIEPILGTFWVWCFFNENFTAAGWAGCVLIMLAVLLLTLEKRNRR